MSRARCLGGGRGRAMGEAHVALRAGLRDLHRCLLCLVSTPRYESSRDTIMAIDIISTVSTSYCTRCTTLQLTSRSAGPPPFQAELSSYTFTFFQQRHHIPSSDATWSCSMYQCLYPFSLLYLIPRLASRIIIYLYLLPPRVRTQIDSLHAAN